ncbi:hypothetical protein WCX49_07565 [Sulfurimonas sp. HSL-1656]|uniref:hypothetical protein n=1 Tax=Thiomicrolovo subterrani TaxID=3131934 RepID=UPI0031F87C5A
MDEFVDAVTSRFKSPYFGYALLAFFALNWRGIFLLTVTDASPQDRLAAFDSVTDIYTLLILPLLTGAAVAASSHWVRFVFGLIARKPLELIDNMHLETEHKKTIRQTELEQSRTELFALKEKELIDRAKRDVEVAEISDKSLKQKLSAEIESLRRERDELSKKTHEIQLSKEAHELLKAAASNKNGTIMKPQTINKRSIQAGGLIFGSESQRDFVKYEAALDELVNHDLVKDRGYKGEIYELTHSGWQFASAL